jgi:hypothetical protein
MDNPPVPGEAKPENPVRAAARLLLARAMEAAGSTVEQVGRENVVCLVHVPAADWTEPARDAWSSWV